MSLLDEVFDGYFLFWICPTNREHRVHWTDRTPTCLDCLRICCPYCKEERSTTHDCPAQW